MIKTASVSRSEVPRRRFALGLCSALVAAALLLVAAPLSAEGGMTPMQVMETRQVSSVALSPDGQLVAYTLSVPRAPGDEADGPAWTQLHVVNPEGQSRPFVSGEAKVSDVAWSPNGQLITFLEQRAEEGGKTLWAIAVDGGEARQIASLEDGLSGYAWSPDGSHLALLAKEAKSEQRKEELEHGFDRVIVDEELSYGRVWVAAVDGDTGMAGEPRLLEVKGSVSDAHWSPDGQRLALEVAPTPLVDDSYTSKRVHVVKVEDGSVLARIENPGKLGDVAWSPDGVNLALVAAEDKHDPSPGRLMVVPASGGELRDVLPSLAASGEVQTVTWKDASTLIFIAHEGVESWLGEVGVDGGAPRQRLAPGGPIWSAMDVADGHIVLEASSPEHPTEAFYLESGQSTAQRLTRSNAWLDDVRLGRQEVVRYQARDGLELEGLLIRPLDEVAGQRYPMVMVVHGGPEAHYSNDWLTRYGLPGQVLAGRGYAVFYPNYRGSTGRGVGFSKLGQGDMAGPEFDDLVDGIDHLVAEGLVDKDKVGVTGGSYGGYATAWAATYYSERFAAAVMFVGISEQIAKMGTSDIINELYLVHELEWPWQDWQKFIDRSPVRWVEKARTPILIAHGDSDPRVHPSQSLLLFRYLKVLGKAPVRLVNYPGEGHGNRRAASQLDYMLRLLRWMDHYLKGPGGEPPPAELDYGLKLAEEDEEPAAAG